VARSYAELLADPELDAVYVALPTALHGELTRAALEAGKHVLCEKPFSANAVEARWGCSGAACSGTTGGGGCPTAAPAPASWPPPPRRAAVGGPGHCPRPLPPPPSLAAEGGVGAGSTPAPQQRPSSAPLSPFCTAGLPTHR
jgi:hypothetical protein